MEDKNHLIEIKNLSVKIKDKLILDNINLTLHNSEIIAIVGPNGSGKTTLLKTILGFYKPFSGEIKILGKSVDELPVGVIGYLPQKDLINYNFPILVKDVVLMTRKLFKKGSFFKKLSEEDFKICYESLARVGMSEYADASFKSLSGGQKQRVLIARLLAMKPKILIFDEPSTGLDVVGQEDFYQLINELKEGEGVSTLLVTHDVGVISGYVDMIACLNRTIHYHGPPSEDISEQVLEKVFGKNIQFVVHDHKCLTCKR